MTTCIKCGKPVADGELFCAQCGLNPGELELYPDTPPARVSAPAGRMQKPQKTAPKPVAKQAAPYKPAPAPARPRASFRGAFAVMCVLCVILVGLCAWQYATQARARVALRVRESDLEQREHTMDELQLELDACTAELEQAKAKLDEQQQQIDSLQSMVNAAESSMSQTQYDMTTQQAQMQLLEQKNAELTAEAEQLQSSVQSLTEENTALAQTNSLFQKKVDFMDAYVVFVEDDGTGWYHKYDCPHFAQKSFWAYSRKLAEKNRYTPCPYCFD